jgi:hypothetical protein
MQCGVGVLPISNEGKCKGYCGKKSSSESRNQGIYFFQRHNDPTEGRGGTLTQKAFILCGLMLFVIGWVISLAAIGHGSLRVFLLAALLCIIGGSIFLRMFVVLTAPDRRSENVHVLPVIISELELGNIERLNILQSDTLKFQRR